MIAALTRLATRHSWPVIFVSVVLFGIAGAFGSGVAESLYSYSAEDPDTESVRAIEMLDAADHRESRVVVLVEDADPRTARGAARVAEVRGLIEEVDGVRGVVGFAETGSPDLLSHDGSSTYLAVQLEPIDDKEEEAVAEHIVEQLAGFDGVLVGGLAVANLQINEKVESDLQRAELFALPILFLLALLFFRGLVAAALPMLVGLLAIISTFAMLSAVNELTDVSVFALNLVIGLGLGLSIDYSLFIVSRYREEIAKHGAGVVAMRRTLATAGRTVIFSSLTVAGSLAALLVFPQNFLYSMGIGGSLIALIAAAIALIVLPAVLALLGERVNALSPAFLRRRADDDASSLERGFWYRLSRLIGRRPGRIATASAVMLIALGIPFLSINFTSVDAQVLPTDTSARQVDDILRAEFPPFRDTPIEIVASGSQREARALAAQGRELDGVAEVRPPLELRGDTWLIEVISRNGALTDASAELVRDLRALPGDQLVGGFTASYEDLHESLVSHIPLALLIIALTTFVVLFLMTGSVVLPIKQLLMNLLGISAVFGILVLVFQDGRLEGLLAYSSQGGLEATQPLLLFAVAFGLSTDYGVFLLSRIKEARDAGAGESESVAIGLERTGRIVTAAALLLAIALGAFVTSEVIFVKQLGLGAALAVLIDATVIRALLVPSLMEMLGRWNWWAPAPLRRLHARIGLSETLTDESGDDDGAGGPQGPGGPPGRTTQAEGAVG